MKYGVPILDAASYKCTFIQSFGPGFSTAVHTFITRALVDDEEVEEKILPLVEKGKELKFSFTDLHESDNTPTQTHIVYSTLLESTRRDGKRENQFTVVSVEKRMLWHAVPKTRFFRAEDALSIISQIAGEYGMGISESMEPCPLPLEFQSLIQAQITDHEFITGRLQSRSPGDFRIFTTDGDKVGWSTLAYKADKPAIFYPEDILSVADSGDSFDTVIRGGDSLKIEAFDPFTKRSLSSTSSGAPVELSTQKPLHHGGREMWYPLRSQEATDVWAKSWQKRAAWGYGYAIHIRGVFGIGEEKKKIEPNLRVSLKGTMYRKHDEQVGLVVQVKHEYFASAYKITLYCVSNAASYP